MNLGWRLGLAANEAHDLFEEGRALAERVGDERSLAMLANLYVANLEAGMGHTRRSRARRYRESAVEARRLARESSDPGVRLAVCVNRGYSLYFAGNLGSALAFLDDTLAKAPADHRIGTDMYLYSPLLWIQSFRGQLLSYMGRPVEAAVALDDAVPAAARHGELENQGWAEDFWVTQSWATGDATAALRHARAAVEIAETTGSAFSRVLAYKALGLAHVLDGAWDEAIVSLGTSLDVLHDANANVLEQASDLALLAEAHLGAGNAERARLLAGEAVAAARRRRTRVYECQAQLARAAVLVRLDGADATRAIGLALARAQLLVQETGARAYAPLVHEQRAGLARLRGDDELARRELAAARREFEAQGAAGHVRRLDDAQGTNPSGTPA
jgi:tetratricopeptide (TPR) repeat protein